MVKPGNAGVNEFAKGHAECRIAEKELENMLSLRIVHKAVLEHVYMPMDDNVLTHNHQ